MFSSTDTSRCWSGLALFVLMVCSRVAVAIETDELANLVSYPERTAPATALSMNDAVISAQIQARVTRVHVSVSQPVAAGDLLVSLDCSDYQLAQQQAQARVKAAKARLVLAAGQRKRNEKLLKQQLTSQEAADTVEAENIAREAELEEAEVGLKSAQLNQSRCEMTAPYSGVITARSIAEGQLASVGTPLINIVDTERMELSARIDPDDVPLITQSSSMLFDYGRRLPVTLLFVGSVVDTQSRNQELRFVFAGEKPPPGTAGKLVWRDPRPFLPARYVVRRSGEWGVFIASEGVAQFHPLPNVVPGRPVVMDLPLDTRLLIDSLGTVKSGDRL